MSRHRLHQLLPQAISVVQIQLKSQPGFINATPKALAPTQDEGVLLKHVMRLQHPQTLFYKLQGISETISVLLGHKIHWIYLALFLVIVSAKGTVTLLPEEVFREHSDQGMSLFCVILIMPAQ